MLLPATVKSDWMVARQPVSRANRLGQTEMAGAAEHNIDCRLQTNPMANRDKYWLYSRPRAEHSTDGLAPIGER